jgi:HlyD family secretion protein
MDRVVVVKYWSGKRLISFIIGGIILFLLVNVYWYRSHNHQMTVDFDKLIIKTVLEGDFLDYTIVSGVVSPEKTIYLDAMEGGRVEDIYAEDGQNLTKGDLILRMSNSNLQMNLMNRESELADQMNNLRNTRLLMEQNRLSLKGQLLDNDYQLVKAKRDYEQISELYQKKLISRNEYQIAKENYDLYASKHQLIRETIRQDSLFRSVQIEQLNDSVKRMNSNLKLIREKMDGLIVKAPVSGQLSGMNVEIGEVKNNGERLGSINVTDSYKIHGEISEYYLNRIKPGLSATAEANNQKIPVILSKIQPEVKNGNFQVDFIFPDSQNGQFHLGQSMLVQLELGQPQKAILLPKGSYFQSTGGQWIFVMDKDQKKAHKRQIKTGKQNPDYYEVTEGLLPGEKVIISNYEGFKQADILQLKKK